ncbi:hypothetical protein [Longispora albida]|uniref:hypothetical protein n=1 Tax=Longispora albida TaxID=203523 RepID=UPI0012FB6D63|nr:hypothetical protein [Longispora albida]
MFGTALALLGLALLIGAPLQAANTAGHWSDLKAGGVSVPAAVTKTEAGGTKGVDKIKLSYTYGGRAYETWTRCGGTTGCREWPAEVRLWINPEDPEDFAKDSDSTDTWVHVRGTWLWTLFGLAMTAVGFLIFYLLAKDARAKRS